MTISEAQENQLLRGSHRQPFNGFDHAEAHIQMDGLSLSPVLELDHAWHGPRERAEIDFEVSMTGSNR